QDVQAVDAGRGPEVEQDDAPAQRRERQRGAADEAAPVQLRRAHPGARGHRDSLDNSRRVTTRSGDAGIPRAGARWRNADPTGPRAEPTPPPGERRGRWAGGSATRLQASPVTHGGRLDLVVHDYPCQVL